MKKAQVNQMFVYLVSIILIVSAGFLVVNFVFSFTADTQLATDGKFYSQIEKDLNLVFVQYDSERSFTYSLSNNIEYVCFINSGCDTSSLSVDSNQANVVMQTDDNLALFDNSGIVSSSFIGNFKIEDNCQCFKPNNRRLELFFQNIRNDVHIKSFN